MFYGTLDDLGTFYETWVTFDMQTGAQTWEFAKQDNLRANYIWNKIVNTD